jgi:hypothetical protein
MPAGSVLSANEKVCWPSPRDCLPRRSHRADGRNLLQSRELRTGRPFSDMLIEFVELESAKESEAHLRI